MKKLLIASILFIILLFSINIYFYFILPNNIITHWNADGSPNGYMSKFWGLFLLPFITSGIFLLFMIIPKIDPLKKNIEKFRYVFNSFVLVFILFMFYIDILSLIYNLGYSFNMSRMFLPALGFLFIYLGIIMKNIKQNWFIGIRTPWTLSNEKVWDKTHNLGSKLFQISGILTFLGIFYPKYSIYFVLAPILLSSVVLVLYSYLVYHKIQVNNNKK